MSPDRAADPLSWSAILDGGAGLAHRITTAQHGTLTINPTSPGAHFTLRLPTRDTTP
ncbi:hypothetical protein OG607_45415 [Streptomyces sp. NBC_01537]|uniref:hypothetical protein n=1 Tax=Streptomyces sp. NBC_01537 TaxID=2903896 RepID=UPI0038702CE9